MTPQHPSYRPDTPAPTAGYYYLKPANLVANIQLDTGGDAYITTVSDNVSAWTRHFEKDEILTPLDGRDPDPMWVLIKTGPR